MEITRQDSVSATIHLYRGELGRLIAYRVRLDTTTRWAVVTSAAIMSFALSNANVPHLVFLLAIWLNLLFLWLEARRYRAYTLVRHRVRLLERGFYGLVLGGEAGDTSDAAAGGWREELRQSLQSPVIRMSYLAACSVRLRRAYLWLLGAVYGAWLVKLHYHGGIPAGAAVGPLSGTAIMIAALALLAALAALTLMHWQPEVE